MPRLPQSRRRAVALVSFALIIAALLLPGLGGAGAQAVLSEPWILPGDAAHAAAAGAQELQQIARGSDTYLAVWTDRRTMLSASEAGTRSPSPGTGEGSQKDIYAARLDAAGQVIDATPIIVDQGGFEQTDPRVGWNGQNWLVVYTSQKEDNYFDYEVRARRVSPAGEVLDAEPIILDPAAAFRETLTYSVIEDGAGNWVVVFSDSLPQEGTAIPRGVLVRRVAPDGAVLDPVARLLYKHTDSSGKPSQYLDAPKMERAGDRYLMTFIAMGPPYRLMGLTFDANFNPLRTGPELLTGNAVGYDLATNGETWFVSWVNGASGNVQSVHGARVSREGDPVDVSGVVINSNVGTTATETSACWDGAFWFVAYSSGYNHATQTYSFSNDIYLSRVAPNGAVAQPNPSTVKAADGTQIYTDIAPGVGGGAEVTWFESPRLDVQAARVTREGAASPDVPLALGAPRQSEVRLASSGAGFLAVFRSETAGVSRIMGQHLDPLGNPVDAEPFVIADGAKNNNPSVGWDGNNYLAVWDTVSAEGVAQTHGRLVPSAGAPFTPAFFIMNGVSPDAAGLNGTFLVVNIIPKTAQIRRTQAVRVSGAGTPLGAPVEIEGIFNFWPRVVAFAGRWLAVWEYHGNHDGSPGTIRGSFVEPDGTVKPPFAVGDVGNDQTPHLAVGPDNQALVVWGTGDIHGRRLNADGTSPEPLSGAALAAAPNSVQARPAVAWDGEQYVVVWVDQRNQAFPLQPRGDIYGARVSSTNVRLEEFAVADSPLPEETPFVTTLNGQSLFAYAKFYDDRPAGTDGPRFTAHRITLRRADLPAPALGLLPSAPSNLVASQTNTGIGTLTLTWADNSDNETGFKVEMRSGTGAWSQIRNVAANTTSVGGITTGVNDSPSFRVRAYNAAGDTAYTNEASAPVAKMNGVSASSNTEPVNVTISATASDAQGVERVEFYTVKDPNYPNFTLLATDTTAPYSHDWANIPAGYYYVRAKAYDAQGSVTQTDYVSFVVYAKPKATISAPTSGATVQPGQSVQISATAQAMNRDEYFLRMEFYANTQLIGTVQGHHPTYNFTWTNPPVGNYSLTARPTTNNGLTGTSEPVNVTVGTPGHNISGRVTGAGGAGIYNAKVTLSGGQSATATTDTAGNFVFTNVAGGANYTVTPSASGYTFSPASASFNGLNASQTANFAGTPGAPVTNDPSAVPIYSQPSDGRAVEGPSSKIPTGQTDREVADDFDLRAQISRVRVRGTRGGQNVPPNPSYFGVYVRFYEWADGRPGALQAEYYLPKGSPGVAFDAAQPTTFDITLPSAFNATGKHFLSVQPVFDGQETWWVASANYPNFRGATWLARDNRAANPAWSSPFFPHDISFDLFGTLLASPVISSFSQPSIERSGLLRVNGANFGGAQGTGRITIGGRTPHVIHWADNLIIAYVPESTALGSVPVEVTTAAGTGASSLNVTARQPNGRIRWRFTLAADYALHRNGIGPDGTVYVNDVNGRLYALTPDGGLKWIFQAGLVGSVGPVTVGADGTIYVAGLVRMAPNCEADGGTPFGDGVFAVNPDGTEKWLFDGTCHGLLAGPNVGPDGKIYGVTDIAGIGAFALTPAGALAWNDGTFGEHGPLGTEVVFGPSAPGLPPTQLYFQVSQQVVNPQGQLFGYTLAGQEVFRATTVVGGQPAAGQLTGNVFAVTFPVGAGYRLRSYTPQGALRWQSPIQPTSGLSAPDVTADESVVYVVQDANLLHAVNTLNGEPVWTYDDAGVLFAPVASPDNRLALLGGRITFGKPGFFVAVSREGRQLWKQQLPDEPGFAEYGQVVPISRARFTADSQTAYAAADVAGDGSQPGAQNYSFFYALDTSANDVPVNAPPRVSLTSPLANSNALKNTAINVAAAVEDDAPVSRVEFFYNHNGSRTSLGADTTAPYAVSFTPTRAGVYGFYAVAYDAGGLSAESEVAGVSVGNESPRVNWVSPADGANFPAGSSFTLVARATDPDGTIAKVKFNSSLTGLVGEDATADGEGNYGVQFVNPPAGAHELHARAVDDEGFERNAVIRVTVGPPPTPTPSPTPTPAPTPVPTPVPGSPAVAVTSPADSTRVAPGTAVPVVADARDTDGGSIAKVEFFRAPFGTSLGADFNAPYSFQAQSGQPDVWSVYAVATDDAGKTARSETVRIIWEDPNGSLSISGRIHHQQSSPENEIFLRQARVELLLRNAVVKTTLTDSNGDYLFNNLSWGGEYTVRPAEPGYQFFPPAATWMGLVENETQDFAASGPLQPGATPGPTPGAGVLAWEKTYNSPQGGGDFDPLLAVDAQGNAYVAATSTVGTGGDTDISVVKYGPTGDQLWSKTWAGPGGYKDWASGVGSDSQGNVYVAGTSWGGSTSEYNMVVLKYDAGGTLKWERTYNGPLGRWDVANALAVDAQGNAVVAGSSQMTGGSNGGIFDEFTTVKYDADGVQKWASRVTEARHGEEAVGVAIGPDGDVYATGYTWAVVNNMSFKNVLTLRLNGATGATVWKSRFGRPAPPDQFSNNPVESEPRGLVLDAGGNVYVYGSDNREHAPAAGSGEEPSVNNDYLLLKYNPSTGTLLWERNWSGVADDYARAAAVDSAGNVYLTGDSYDGAYESAISYQTSDAVTVKFNPAGDLLWSRAYRGFAGKWDGGRGVVLDPSGNVYVGLISEGFVNNDTSVIKYQSDGTESWVYRYDNPHHTHDSVRGVATDGAGNVYLAGQAPIPNGAGQETSDIVTFKLSASAATLNSPPSITFSVKGPTIAGGAVFFDPSAAGAGFADASGGRTAPGPSGPTIAGRTLLLTADAKDIDGSVARVDFFDGLTLIGSDNTAPYEVQWNNVPEGKHAVTAMARDNSGGTRSAQTEVVTVTAPSYRIGGTVRDAGGAVLPGVTVTLGGSGSASTTSAADGSYVFDNMQAGGSYTVTPSKAGYTFTPGQANVESLGENRTADFAATLVPTGPPVNFALAANGGAVTASSSYGPNYPAASLNNSDRRGLNWNGGGGWNDATGGAFPDWVEVSFNDARIINEVDVFTLQDNPAAPSEPTEAMAFTKYGVTGFEVRYWTGSAWAQVPGASVSGNDKVWRKLTFPAVTTTKLRVVVTGALADFSRLVEVEAWGPGSSAPAPSATPTPTPTPVPAPVGRANVALASNGGAVTASSSYSTNYPASSLNNGDRRGLSWNAGGGWNDATSGAYPDWVEVSFAGERNINEIDVFTLQDAPGSPSEPTEAQTFTKYGVTAMRVEYWTGSAWATVPDGAVTSNDKVWRKFTFPAVSTSKVRVVVLGALADFSRLVEVEAWQVGEAPSVVNHALAANGGAVAASSSYSSNYPAASLNNGDRRGLNWNSGGGWNDATGGAFPDWVEVSFGGARTVNQVDVFTLQDTPGSPSEPTETMPFTKYGVTGFEVRYWDEATSQWALVEGGKVTSNDKVWRRLSFPAVTTTKLRVVVTGALADFSRLVEVEAWGPSGGTSQAAERANVALATNGGAVTASSSYGPNYPAASLNNGDRRGVNWNAGGGWNDGTGGTFPDWVEVSFGGEKSVGEVHVFTLQDDPTSPSEPTEAMAFTKYGVTAMRVEYWNGSAWAQVPGASVSGNDKVWRRLTFPAVTTTKLRLVVTGALAGYSRLVEVEVY